jgi:hypothetical protein
MNYWSTIKKIYRLLLGIPNQPSRDFPKNLTISRILQLIRKPSKNRVQTTKKSITSRIFYSQKIQIIFNWFCRTLERKFFFTLFSNPLINDLIAKINNVNREFFEWVCLWILYGDFSDITWDFRKIFNVWGKAKNLIIILIF